MLNFFGSEPCDQVKSLRISRSSHQQCSIKIDLLKNFTKFTGKHLCQSFFFNKVARLRSATLLKKRLWHTCFLVNFVKFLRTTFLQNISGRLFLNFQQVAFWFIVLTKRLIVSCQKITPNNGNVYFSYFVYELTSHNIDNPCVMSFRE